MKNKKGFAFAGIMYTVLIVFALLMVSLLVGLQNRKTVLSELKGDTAEALNCGADYRYLLNEINDIKIKIGDSDITSINDGTIKGSISYVNFLLNKVEQVKNELGETDISGIGDGTITGAISSLNTDTNSSLQDDLTYGNRFIGSVWGSGYAFAQETPYFSSKFAQSNTYVAMECNVSGTYTVHMGFNIPTSADTLYFKVNNTTQKSIALTTVGSYSSTTFDVTLNKGDLITLNSNVASNYHQKFISIEKQSTDTLEVAYDIWGNQIGGTFLTSSKFTIGTTNNTSSTITCNTAGKYRIIIGLHALTDSSDTLTIKINGITQETIATPRIDKAIYLEKTLAVGDVITLSSTLNSNYATKLVAIEKINS
ncbi:MAG: hypothetical protein PHN42_02915 [Bacilli bacterium]|nr:hypothetical protein [Bacilli bacterium]